MAQAEATSLREEVTQLLQEPVGSTPSTRRERDGRRRAPCAITWRRRGLVRALLPGAASREPRRSHRGRGGAPRSRSSRTDTVLADPAEGSRSVVRDLVDSEVWGGGALDMKGQAAASAPSRSRRSHARTTRSGRSRAAPRRGRGGRRLGGHEGYGLRWLVQAHPEVARCDCATNEGGGDRLVLGGNPVLRLRDGGEDVLARSPSGCAGAAGTRRCRGSPTTRS